MPFEFFNPHNRAIECTVHRPIGAVFVPIGSVVPTPDQEKAGITAEALKDFVSPSFLRPTPPALRRRLLEAMGLPVPENILVVTSHLAEFGGGIQNEDPIRMEEIIKVETKSPPPPVNQVKPTELPVQKQQPTIKKEIKKGSSVDDLQRFADAAASSFSMKRRRPRGV